MSTTNAIKLRIQKGMKFADFCVQCLAIVYVQCQKKSLKLRHLLARIKSKNVSLFFRATSTILVGPNGILPQ